MLYVALGDSITYGYSAEHVEDSYVNRLRADLQLQARENVSVVTVCKPGWTLKQLARAVRKVPDWMFQEAKVVTLLIGGNDLVNAFPWVLYKRSTRLKVLVRSMQSRLESILRHVRRNFKGPLVVSTLYNPFPESETSTIAVKMWNQAIVQSTRRYRGKVVNLQSAFEGREDRLIESFRKGSLLDFRFVKNPIHPTSDGHAVIAREFMRALLRGRNRARTESGTKRPIAKSRRKPPLRKSPLVRAQGVVK